VTIPEWLSRRCRLGHRREAFANIPAFPDVAVEHTGQAGLAGDEHRRLALRGLTVKVLERR
jgi:hypothetical protein